MSHMFLCNSCIKGLKFSDEQIKEVVNFSEITDKAQFKCYVCSAQKNRDEGLYLTNEKIAEILQTVLDKMDAEHQKIKNNIITCRNCGKEHNSTESIIVCSCGNEVKVKEEIKMFKLGMVKRIAYKVLINSVRKGGLL